MADCVFYEPPREASLLVEFEGRLDMHSSARDRVSCLHVWFRQRRFISSRSASKLNRQRKPWPITRFRISASVSSGQDRTVSVLAIATAFILASPSRYQI